MSDEERAATILRELWDEHSTAFCGDQLGMGVPFQTFYCTACRTPYPCAVARKVAAWGTLNPDYEFLSVRAPVKGETIHATGRSASLEGHSWAIGEANPPVPALPVERAAGTDRPNIRGSGRVSAPTYFKENPR